MTGLDSSPPLVSSQEGEGRGGYKREIVQNLSTIQTMSSLITAIIRQIIERLSVFKPFILSIIIN